MLNIGDLAIEVTRRCNMQCAHCLRGDPQHIDMPIKHVFSLMKRVRSIGSICFTGGEPTLNSDVIKQTLAACRINNVSVGSFYVVTNGKHIPDEFIHDLIKWYEYCYEPDMCAVTLSNDVFHDAIPNESRRKLEALSFFNDTDKAIDWHTKPLVNTGRAKTLTSFPKRERTMPSEDCFDLYKHGRTIDIADETLSLTVHGEILAGCDYEYNNTDDIFICDVTKLYKTFSTLCSDPNANIFPRRNRIHA